MKTGQQLAQDALDMQDACNLLGLINALPKVAEQVRQVFEEDNGTLRHNPIIKLWLHKMVDLTVEKTHDTDFSRAFFEVSDLAEGKPVDPVLKHLS